MKFETKCKKLGITDEVQSIIDNCDCGEIKGMRIVELDKLRKWEIQETIGNYLDWIDKDGNDYEWNYKYCRMTSFCEAFAISENRITEWYSRAICEHGYEIAYTVKENVVLILE